MSFRWFIYYCSLLGGCAAYLGWAVGRVPPVQHHVWQAAVKGLFLGLLLAVVLTVIDILWNLAGQKSLTVILRLVVAGLVGSLGGFMGGMSGQFLYEKTNMAVFLLLGWTVTGLLIGIAPGLFDLFSRLLSNEDARGAIRKVLNGILGGTLGGIVGSLLFLAMQKGWEAAVGDRANELWSPSATGFVALGLCIGLFIGLAQVFLKEAWIKVVEGFRAGRELILTRPNITIGRAEGCEIALFGDNGIEKQHATIQLEGGRYFVEDLETPGGTFINGERIRDRVPLRAGDEIQVGRSVLRFGERAKRTEEN